MSGRLQLCYHTVSTPYVGKLNPIPFRDTKQSLRVLGAHVSYDRFTHVQLLFTWNPSPLQSSKTSFEYLLLPPRSALGAIYQRLAPATAR